MFPFLSLRCLKKFFCLPVAVLLFSFTQDACGDVFNDVPDYYWAAKSVELVGMAGIIRANDSNMFQPEKSVSKMEALVVLEKCFFNPESIENARTSIAKYPDKGIDKGGGFIELALNNGLLQENELATMQVFAPASRLEIARWLCRGLQLIGPSAFAESGVINFSDIGDLNSLDYYAVASVVDSGLMRGESAGLFQPDGEMTRSELATLVVSIFAYSNKSLPNIEVTEGIIYQFNSVGPQSGIILASAPEKAISLSDHTLYYYQGMSAATNDVQVGDQVKLYLDSRGTIRMVEIVNKASLQQLTGNIFISMDPDRNYINYFENGLPVHKKLTSGATVSVKKQPGTLDDLEFADKISMVFENDEVISVEKLGRGKGGLLNFSGEVIAFDRNPDQVALKVSNGNWADYFTVNLTDQTSYTYEDHIITTQNAATKLKNGIILAAAGRVDLHIDKFIWADKILITGRAD